MTTQEKIRLIPALSDDRAEEMIESGLTVDSLSILRKKDLRVLLEIQCVSAYRTDRVEKTRAQMINDLVNGRTSRWKLARKRRIRKAKKKLLARCELYGRGELERMKHKSLVKVMIGLDMNIYASEGISKSVLIERILEHKKI